jgi:hypothetical protein
VLDTPEGKGRAGLEERAAAMAAIIRAGWILLNPSPRRKASVNAPQSIRG